MANPDGNVVIHVSTDTLLRFIKTYDGNRDDLSSWIANCDRAYNLASEEQKTILFAFIQNQLTDRAQSTCSNSIFDSWPDLKNFLKSRFGNKKHQTHLLLDLQNCKQSNNETVTQYIQRIETCLKRLLTCIKQSSTNETLLPGQIESTNQLALQTFLLGINPRLSQMLRSREPQTLNDAFNIALEEEKFNMLQYSQTYKRSIPIPQNSSGPSYRPMNNFNKKIFHVQPSDPNIQPQTKFCRYCRKPGHLIENCFKRQRRNNQQNNNPLHRTRNNNNPVGNPNVNHLNSTPLEDSAAPSSLVNAIQALSI